MLVGADMFFIPTRGGSLFPYIGVEEDCNGKDESK